MAIFQSASALSSDRPPPAVPLATPSLRRRMACWLYEGILLFGVMFLADYLFDALSQSRHAMNHRHTRMAYLFVVFGIYFVWFWTRGQTLAMKTWHIRLVDVSGRAVTQQRAMVRYLLSWTWFVPPLAIYLLGIPILEVLVLLGGWIALWALASRLHPQRQFWHDVWAGTRLVQDFRLPPNSPAASVPPT
jgi:uncharacterized RDD family membrane protein YckC